jgi:replication initiation and membrane attachment protein
MRLDKFKLMTYQNIDTDERNVVTLLYAPLIGCKPFLMYNMLWSMIDRSRLKSPEYMHSKLYDLLELSPIEFLQARKVLEAIGLLCVYQKDDLFLYELKAPVSAEEFLKDGALGALLYEKIGKAEFDDITNLFRITISDKEGYENVTAHFDEVFKGLKNPAPTNGDYVSRSKSQINISHPFDFDIFFEGISKNYIDRRKISSKVEEKIVMLSYVYDLDEITMQKVFMDSVDNERNINLDKMSKSAKYWNSVIHSKKETNEYEEIDVTFENIKQICLTHSPIDCIGYATGHKPSKSEMKTIEQVISEFEYPKEILNYLLLYSMNQSTNHLLPHYNFIESIYVSMKRDKVTTFEDAFNFTTNYQTKSDQREVKKKEAKKYEPDWLEDVMKEL